MQNLLSKADSIELKIKQILSKLEMLKNENAFLKEENKNLVEKLNQQKGTIKALEDKSNHKESKSLEKFDEEKKAAWRKEIDTHIAEIDQVINALST